MTVQDHAQDTVTQQRKFAAKFQDQQSWVVKQVTPEESERFAGLYTLQNLKRGTYLHVPSKSGAEAQAVDLVGAGQGVDRTYWELTDEENGRYGLRNDTSLRASEETVRYRMWLGIRNLSREEGGVLEQCLPLSSDDRPFQFWRFEQPEVPREEPRVCGGSFESYIGTYKGTYKAVPVRLPDGTSEIGRGIGSMFGGADAGGSFGRAIGEGVAQFAAETYDVTARFYLDGNDRKVEVTTLKHKPGAKPFTDVCGFGLNLSKSAPAAEFHVKTAETYVVGEPDPMDPNFDVTSESQVRDLDRKGRAVDSVISFSVQATDCSVGSHQPRRLHETRTEKGLKIEIDLHRV
nr:RICIN domain-containing protein [Streptomyces sp. SID8354]